MNDFFSTKEFYLSAWLVSNGVKMSEIRRLDNNGKCVFVFEKSKNIERLLKEYWDREGKIEVRKFIESVKDLKSQLHADTY